ncbi:OMA1_2 [Sanghuangporus sanghuang]
MSFNTAHSPENDRRDPRIIKSARILSLVLAFSVLGGLQYFLVFRHLERVPHIGRWRKMNISPEQEVQLGEDAYFSIIRQYPDAVLPEYHPITRHIREIVTTILDANDLGIAVAADDPVGSRHFANGKARRWRLAVVVDENVPNSTASSGGIVVFTGLLSVCKDENELAAILGHEIAHVVARHLAERYSKAKDWSLKQLLFGPSVQRNPRQIEEDYKQMMAVNLHEQELEADAIGLQLTARACFDPKAAITVNERLARLEERLHRLRPERKPTHPLSEERIKARSCVSLDITVFTYCVQQLERLLPKAYGIVSSNPKCS